ncbi:conserved repeat domain-containing protein [Micromonospora purpureochromogenes]|uniref:Conserved repeat domain-containing protein n=1 Tax=Micromonospora purpureochromogenes TaxID=47872 RepID=A0A1C4V254_9ACTN|nr:DUF11 domain-containing protein [Micromonospora purpureochromogenes]SCE78170.1 conserved repeat domain-containing protein [Micromonospora purpureochromogenes]
MHPTPHLTRRTRLAGASGLAALLSLAAATLPAAPAAAAPPRADLAVTATAIAPRDQVVDVGGGATVEVQVRNAGTRSASDVTLTYGLPDGAYFSDGNGPPQGWTCDFGPAATCRYGALAAGASAPPLRFDFYLPPAPAGTVSAVTATAKTTSPELSTSNNTGSAPITYVRGVTDLEVIATQADPAQPIVGDTVNVSVQVRNAGNMTAELVHVTVPLPAGLTRVSEDYNSPWYCEFGSGLVAGQPGWDCLYYQMVDGWTPEPLHLSATIAAAVPGDVVTFTAKATTTSPEDDLADNTGQTSVTVAEPGTVRGTVWLDADRDGVRDADETGVTGAQLSVLVGDQTGQTYVRATVAADGTWTALFRSGEVVASFTIQAPYCFADSADGDLAMFQNYSYGGGNASSNPASLAPAGEAIIDAAVVRC